MSDEGSGDVSGNFARAARTGVPHSGTKTGNREHPCAECGVTTTRRGAHCSKRCGDKAYRRVHADTVKKQVRTANTKRYATDPEFRQQHVEQKRKWTAKKRRVIGGGRTASGYRSQMEERLAPEILSAGGKYEHLRFDFPAKMRRYMPDFILPNGIVLEVKGWFQGKDRAKLLAVKKLYPSLDLRLVLATPNQFITQRRVMTQAEWCEKNGFPWAHNRIPQEWIEALPAAGALEAVAKGIAVQKKK